jgi:hypothetical protein
MAAWHRSTLTSSRPSPSPAAFGYVLVVEVVTDPNDAPAQESFEDN